MKKICLSLVVTFISCLGIRESVSSDKFDPRYHDYFEKTGERFGNFNEIVDHFDSLYHRGIVENDITCEEKFGFIEISFREYCHIRENFSKISQFKTGGGMEYDVKNMEAIILGNHFFIMHSENLGSYSRGLFKPKCLGVSELQPAQLTDACANTVFWHLKGFREKSEAINQSLNKKIDMKRHCYQ